MAAEIKRFTPEFDEFLRDESRHGGSAEAIVFAKNEADVREALAQGMCVTVQGARTGIAAGAVPRGGLVLNLGRMRRVGEVRGDRLSVQPGVPLSDLRKTLEPTGLFFPPDPTETSASVGGMLACNASGARSFRYGPTRRWVEALRVMLADGDILRVARGAKLNGLAFSVTTESGRTLSGELPQLKAPEVKNAAGYHVKRDMDLLDLFIGMEGTLGVIVGAELKLLPVPPIRQALCAFFPAEEKALAFVRFLRNLPENPPVAIEFFGHRALALLRRSKDWNPTFAELPTLPQRDCTAIQCEFHGDGSGTVERGVMAAAERMEELGADADECWFADNPREIEIHKAFRHAVPEAVNLLIDRRRAACPGLVKLGTDMSVPDEHLEAVMRLYRDGLAVAGLEHVVFGHAGNNHLHVNILPRNMDELERGKALHREWARRIVVLGGSVSAEHGIGKTKTALLETMFGADGMAAMRRIRNLFDPAAILNPGNLFAAEGSPRS